MMQNDLGKLGRQLSALSKFARDCVAKGMPQQQFDELLDPGAVQITRQEYADEARKVMKEAGMMK